MVNSGSDNIQRIDLSTNTVTNPFITLPAFSNPWDILLSGNVAYITNFVSDTVTVAKRNSPDPTWQAQVWDILHNEALSSPLPVIGRPTHAAVSPDGSYLITIADKVAPDLGWQGQVWMISTGESVSQWTSEPTNASLTQPLRLPSGATRLRRVSFTGDSRRVVVVGGVETFGDSDPSYGETTLWYGHATPAP